MSVLASNENLSPVWFEKDPQEFWIRTETESKNQLTPESAPAWASILEDGFSPFIKRKEIKTKNPAFGKALFALERECSETKKIEHLVKELENWSIRKRKVEFFF